MPSARLADSWRMRRSPPEHGRFPLARAVMAASQSMATIAMPSLVPCWMNLLAKAAAQLAAQAFSDAAAELMVAEEWQDEADAEKAIGAWPWDVPGDLWDAAAATADRVSDAASGDAQTLAQVAQADEATADADEAAAQQMASEYAREVKDKVSKAAHAVGRVLKRAGRVAGKAAVAVGKAAYKDSGAQSVVSCVTDPKVSSCVQAAITVATVVSTDGVGGIVAGAAEDAGEGLAADAVTTGAEDLGSDAGASTTGAIAEEAGAGAAGEGTPIYRGVASNHNVFPDAEQGIASPGDVAGHADVLAHNAGDTWTSRLTSWSTDPEVAEGFAG
jgi:hypothetical protein